MRRTALATLVVLLTAPADAQTGIARDLIEIESQADRYCRGSPNENASCDTRDQLSKVINRLGYCYGKRGQIGADMAWHRCGPTSQRQP